MSSLHRCRTRAAAAAATLLSASVLSVVSPGQAALARAWGPEQDIGAEVALANHDEPAMVRVRGNRTAVAAWVAAGEARVTVARRKVGGRWTTPRALSADVRRSAVHDLAVARSGLASVVWERKVGGRWRIEESHLEDGTWTAPVRVGRGRKPEVVVAGTGVTTVAWRRHGVRVARRPEGGGWRTPRRLAAGNVSGLELASNPHGDVALVWTAAHHKVRATVRPPGRKPWREPVTLGKGPYVTSMRVEMGGSGRALVLWTVTDVWNEAMHDYQNYVAWARSDFQGRWSRTRKLTRRLGEDGGQVALSMNGPGFAVATWIQVDRSDSPAFLWAARFRPEGSWIDPARVSKAPVSWRSGPRAWLDRNGVARAFANRRAIWQFSQRPGAGWTGRRLNPGRLLDAHGAGSRLDMIFHRRTLWSRTLDVR